MFENSLCDVRISESVVYLPAIGKHAFLLCKLHIFVCVCKHLFFVGMFSQKRSLLPSTYSSERNIPAMISHL